MADRLFAKSSLSAEARSLVAPAFDIETILTIDRAEYMEAASRSALEPLKDELEPLPDSDGPAPVKAVSPSPAEAALSNTQELVSMESLMGWSDLASRAVVETPLPTD